MIGSPGWSYLSGLEAFLHMRGGKIRGC